MSSSKRSIPIYLVITSLVIHVAIGADPLYHFCFSDETYTNYSPYARNLNELLNQLSTKTPPTGFGVGSTWPPRGKDPINGLALCRGDVKKTECKTCVVDAGKELLHLCPNKKGAIIWYDNCLLKYSNQHFFGVIDEVNKVYLYNVNDAENPIMFNKRVKELLSGLSTKAYANKKYYASGELNLGRYNKKLYGMAQCTRDISSMDCKKCIDDAINELPNCCNGKIGARVIGGSCNIRYEVYPFLN